MRGPSAKVGRNHGWLLLWSLCLCVALLLDPAAMSAGKRRDKSQPRPAAPVWNLAFQDEFDGNSLDERLWETQFPWGRDRSSVGELQYYAPDAFSQANSKLSIFAQPTPGGSHAYSSGLISSHKSFTMEQGRFEIRCKIPRGKGLWPAFWLLPVDTSWPPEIDVFEALGNDTDTVHMTAHWSEQGDHRRAGAEYSGPDFSEGFHTFAVEWSADSVVWFVDGSERHRVANWSYDGPMYLLANLAVGGNWPGAPDASTAFPAAFEIDYIRAYTSEATATVDGDRDQDKKVKKKVARNTTNKRKRGKQRARGQR